MNLLLSSYYYPPSIGGVERQSHLLARGLTRRGHSVRVISARLAGFKTDEVLDGVNIHRVGPGRGSRWQRMATYVAGMLAATVRASGWADIIQVQQTLYPAASVALLAPTLRRPLVVRNAGSGQFGGVQLMNRVPLGRLALQVIARTATGIALNSEMMTEMRAAGFRRLVEIPSGVDVPDCVTPEERNTARESLGLDGPVVLYVGRFEAEKGVDTLIHAWHSARVIGATLLLVGEGPEREQLQRLALRGSNTLPVRFEGPSTEVSQYYRAADLFVLPSRSEGISNALLEAMSYGVSVIATNVGGNREVLDTQQLGKLVAPSDPRALASAIEQLLSHTEKRSGEGLASRAHVLANYSVEQMLDRYEGLYAKLNACDVRPRVFRC